MLQSNFAIALPNACHAPLPGQPKVARNFAAARFRFYTEIYAGDQKCYHLLNIPRDTREIGHERKGRREK